MDDKIPRWQIGGFLFTSIAGTLLHFLFDWTGGSVAAGLVSAVNESIWEHMKLIYVPMLVFALIEYRKWGKDCGGFWRVKLLGLLLALVLIPVLFYSYTGILGVRADWFNITIFFIAAGAAYRFETALLSKSKCQGENAGKGWLLILLIGVLFVVFTFLTPRIPLFQDPITGTYGFQR